MEKQQTEILEPSVGCNMPSEVSHSKHTAHPAGVDHCGEGSSNHGDIDQHGEDFLHPRDVDHGREDSPCKSCLDIKSKINTFINSEGTGNIESNALKTIGNPEVSGFRLGKETLIVVKEEVLEEKICMTDSSKRGKTSQGDIAPPGCKPSEVSHSRHTACPGVVDLGGVDSAHPRCMDRDGVDSSCTFCLEIKAEIDTFIHSEVIGIMKPNAHKTIGNQELTGIQIKEEHMEEKCCVIDGSKIVNDIQRDTSPPPKLSPLDESVGPGLPLPVPEIDSTVPTETHHNHQLGPGVTTRVTLCDRGMECFYNNPGCAMSKKIKTVKRCQVLGNKYVLLLYPKIPIGHLLDKKPLGCKYWDTTFPQNMFRLERSPLIWQLSEVFYM